MKKVCIFCGKKFKTDKFNFQKYCSHSCYYQKNKERLKIYKKNWSKKHLENGKKADKKWYDKHSAEKIKYVLERRKLPEVRERYRSYARKYQMKRRGYDNKATPEQEEYVRKRDKYKCVYCYKETNLTLDHIISLKKGGKDIIQNLVVACNNCNSSKKYSDVFIWCKRKSIKVPKIVIKLLKKQEIQNITPTHYRFPTTFL